MSQKLIEVAIEILKDAKANFIVNVNGISYMGMVADEKTEQIALTPSKIDVYEEIKPIVKEDDYSPKENVRTAKQPKGVKRKHDFHWTKFGIKERIMAMDRKTSIVFTLDETNPQAPIVRLQSTVCNYAETILGKFGYKTEAINNGSAVKLLALEVSNAS